MNELADATLDQLFPRKTTWIYVIKNVMMSLSGKASQLYRHDLVQLYSKKNYTFGLASSVDSVMNRLPEKFMPRKFIMATGKVTDTKGCVKCCVAKNEFNGYHYLCGVAQSSIFLMQWYNPLNKFMLLKSFDYYLAASKPLRMFEMIISSGNEYPILVTDVKPTSDPNKVNLEMINLNQQVWSDKERTLEAQNNSRAQYDLVDAYNDGAETMIPAKYNKSSVACVKQLDMETLVVAFESKAL